MFTYTPEATDETPNPESRGYTEPMTANNFNHELFHSFNAFAGFGSFGRSNTGTLGAIPGLVDWARGLVTGDARENPSADDTEVLADLGMFASTGLIDSNRQPGVEEGSERTLADYYRMALQQAILYNASPESAASLVVPGGSTQSGTISEGYNLRLGPNDDNVISPPFVNSVTTNTPATAIGVSADGEWVYVGFAVGEGHQYAWVNVAGYSSSDDIADLPVLDAAMTNPQRQPDTDVLNGWVAQN